MTINVESFLEDLNESINDAQLQELEIELTNDLEADRGAITNKNQANYFVRLVKDIDTDIEQVNELVDQEIKSITENLNKFREERLKTLNNQKYYYETILRDYTLRELEGKKAKSVKLPYGTLAIRQPSPKYVYDEKVATAWLETNKPEFTKEKVTVTIDKTYLKKEGVVQDNGTLLIDGVEIPGVSVVEQELEFKVK